MRVCFIHTPCPELDDDRLEPNLGLLYLATFLRQHGFEVEVADFSAVSIESAAERIPSDDLYGFSTFSVNYHLTRKLAQATRQRFPGARLVAGGPHATALPEAVKQDFDVVVTGEGELAMLELAQALRAGTDPLPHIIHGQGPRDLDVLPFPDRDLVDLPSYSRIVNGQRSLSVLTARGCHYRCVFCNSNIMGASSRSVRFRSPVNVAREIQWLQEKHDISRFRLQDDTFTTSLERIRALTSLLRPLEIRYRCFGRLDKCREREMTDLLAEGGCCHIAFGVESGSPRILGAMDKRQTVDDIRAGITNAKASGLTVRVYLIVGFPSETDETIQETVNLMQECQPHEFMIYPCIPYPGTPLWERPEKFGITHINRDYSQYVQIGRGRKTAFALRTATFDEHQVEVWRQYMIDQLGTTILWSGNSPHNK